MTENTTPNMETEENITTPDSAEVKSADTPENVVESPEATDVPAEENPLQKLQAEVERFRDLALRNQADLDNYRKRAAREKEEAIRFANASLLEKLLPVLDNFELGLDAAKDHSSPIYQGMSMVLRQIENFLRDNGVETIDAVGQPFDPNKHEAVGHEPSTEVADGLIIRQTRKGYALRERLLRPASVFVSKGNA